MDEASGYVEVAHTADWALKAWSPDLENLMVTAARGMYALSEMVFSEDVVRRTRFSVDGIDAESLLVAFLSELLYYAESDMLGLDQISIVRNGFLVQVQAIARKIVSQKKEIKAVTYHNLEIRQTARGLETVLVFDV